MKPIQKNAIEQIRIERKEYESHTFIDLRLWVLSDSTRDYIPTRKGVTLREEYLDSVIQALSDLRNDTAK